MATFILLAGAWHGSWCWSEVVPLLRAAGHRVLTPDLTGMDDGGAAGLSDPLATWAEQVVDVIEAQDRPVILVGHSRAGLVLSEVAERIPERIDLLIYLCAFLLRDGQTLQEVAAQASNAEDFAGAMVVHPDGTGSIAEESASTLLYNNTPSQVREDAARRLVPEPILSFGTPVHVTDERFGSVPRVYIACVRDAAIPIATQRAMQANLPCAASVELDSDHSPFLSMPTELAKTLDRMPGLPQLR